jgi:chemotaxis protein CheD
MGLCFLHPGDVVIALAGDRVETLLGSCISAILTDSERTVGAICRVVHSRQHAQARQRATAQCHEAIDAMYAHLKSSGLDPTLCDAFVFGGGNMFPDLIGGGHVGEDNAHRVLSRLEQDGIRILQRHVGGPLYRRVSWIVGRGAPLVTAFEMNGKSAFTRIRA